MEPQDVGVGMVVSPVVSGMRKYEYNVNIWQKQGLVYKKAHSVVTKTAVLSLYLYSIRVPKYHFQLPHCTFKLDELD